MTKVPRTNWMWLTTAALLACACVSGCAEEGPYRPPDTTMRIPDSAVLSGVVSADGPADVAVDIGAARPVSVTLAELTVADCGPDGNAALAAALVQLLPPGTPVALVRSGARPPGDALSAFVHVRPAHATGPVRPTGPSVNQLVLAAGRARLAPGLDRSAAAAPLDRQIDAAAARLPDPDRSYLPQLAGAESAAWNAGAGVLPGCVARQRDLDRPRPSSNAPAPPAAASALGAPSTDIHIDIDIPRRNRPRPWCHMLSRC